MEDKKLEKIVDEMKKDNYPIFKKGEEVPLEDRCPCNKCQTTSRKAEESNHVIDMEAYKLYVKAYELWGQQEFFVFAGELAECIQAICKYARTDYTKFTKKEDERVSKLAEEVADAQVILDSIVAVMEHKYPDFNFEYVVSNWMEVKIKKLKKNMILTIRGKPNESNSS